MIIAPSLLAADFRKLSKEVERAADSGAEWLHLDIMDGIFVPNISFGPSLVAQMRPLTRMFFDVHLMCSKPQILLEPFAKAGADEMIIHVELGDEAVTRLIWDIKKLGKKVGLAVNPPTNIASVEPFLDKIDLLLVMTVNPGFGGQSFIHECLSKVRQADEWRRERNLRYRLEVDGGINDQTAGECAREGADTFVAGTSLFSQRNMKAAVTRMRKSADANDPSFADLKFKSLPLPEQTPPLI